MSEQAKTSNTAYYVRLSVTLFTISLVVALLLGVVNGVTKDKIAAIKEEKTQAALQVVMPGCEFEKVEITEDMTAAASAFESKLSAVFAAKDGSGYVLEVVPSGFGGDIDMVVGVANSGAVKGVSVISASETAGVGTKVTSNKNNKKGIPVLDQFVGKSASDGELVVGSNVDAVSGATVSSKGVTRGVNAALSVAALLG